MAGALYRYNNSGDYVAAVQDYAHRMRADPRAYAGYYDWQVIYARVDGAFLLPIGCPGRRPSGFSIDSKRQPSPGTRRSQLSAQRLVS